MAFAISKGRTAKAVKVVLYGIEGIGKSTFASQFPDPVFIDTEGSTQWMDVARLPEPTSWEMIMAEVEEVKKTKPCKTLVIDTIDWAEQLAIENVCKINGKGGIEDFGYGQGYTYVKETFGRLLNSLQEVVDAGINVVLTAHAAIRTFTKPDEMGQYDRYELKLINTPKVKNTELVKEWADMLLFANYKTILVKDSKDSKSRAVGGERKMYTQHAPSYDAKNRFGLAEELPFEFAQIAHVFNAVPTATSGRKKNEEVIAKKEEPVRTPETASETAFNLTDEVQLTKSDMAVINQLPKALAELMIGHKVKPEEIQKVVGKKGYFPANMPLNTYPLDFMEQVLIAAWSQVFKMVEDERLPF